MAPIPTNHNLWHQLGWLLFLAIPVACIARTIVYEEVFREPREWCKFKSQSCNSLLQRKFFYLFTCEYCFSHWVSLAFVAGTQFQLLLPDWRGYIIAFFAVVLIANVYLNLYARLRVDITREKAEIKAIEKNVEDEEARIQSNERDD